MALLNQSVKLSVLLSKCVNSILKRNKFQVKHASKRLRDLQVLPLDTEVKNLVSNVY